MGWITLANTVLKAILKLAEVIDRARKRNFVEERAKRLQDLRDRIDNDPVAGLNSVLSGKSAKNNE